MADLARSHGIHVFYHTDGAARDIIPDLLTVTGIEVLNPIQWRCPGMDMGELKAEFGSQICFHGAIDNQQTLPFGTPEEVRAEVRRCIDTLAADGTGYILAPCHNIQAVSPVENIIAMYDEAWHYGAR
jgi:uroporphyrinogen decarboxylase